MSSPPKRALHRYLIVLALAAILPLTALTGLGLYEVYERQRDLAQRRAFEVTRAIAVAVDAELQRSIAALEVLASNGSLRRGDIGEFRATLERAAGTQPNWSHAILASADGTPIFNTHVAPGAEMPLLMDPESFRDSVANRAPRVGYIMNGPRRRAFAVRAPVVVDDRVPYVVSAVVEPGTIVDVLKRQGLPESWTISVFDAHGRRVARSRQHERFLGEPAAPSLQALIREHGREGMGITRLLEGDEAFSAYTTLASGWIVATAIDTANVTGPALRTVEVYGAAVLVSLFAGMLAVLAVARRINGPMARLRDDAKLLGTGGMPAPATTSIREIAEVNEALRAAAAQRRVFEQEREALLRQAEAGRVEAEESNRAKDRFLAMLGHELRNPLAALLNASSVLRLAKGDTAAVQRASEVVQRQVAHLARLTDDLLDVARATLGKVQLRPQAVDLAVLVGDALATLAATGRTSGHTVHADLQPAWVHADSVRIEQIVSNLVVNAVKYTPRGGTIHVRTSREGDSSVLLVSDDGAGMSPELAARAFDLFVQGEHAGVDRAPGGLGIGLTLVRRLAELHGGSADVASDGEGRGSEFIVRLPAIAPPESLP